MRESGVLMPIFSFSSRYGIGCFSKEAYDFVDFLVEAGQSTWQILPIGPTGFGDSPYQSFSTFAGNPYFIDLEALIKAGLLIHEECDRVDFGSDENSIDYEKMYHARFEVLKLAFERFQHTNDPEFDKFITSNAYWLDDYCLFMALKDQNNGVCWLEWNKPLRIREPEALESARMILAEEIRFYQFQQYMFRKQWNELHQYAAKKGIEIIGDIPIYVALDSADTWANPQLFQLDEENQPISVSGCPPDAFAPQGQLWGNPLYRWEYHKETGYSWWINRMRYCFELYDVLRLDHFRGFDEYYSIPASDETAEYGEWRKGPGMDFFEIVKQKLGNVKIIAEDLGFLTDSVRQLVSDTGYPGMKVLQFAFDSRETSNYLPCFYDQNCVVYTGTHDNDTTAGWFEALDPKDQELALDYMSAHQIPKEELYLEFVKLALASVGNLCVIPIQDYLGLDSKARINIPSTVGSNWIWRLEKGSLTKELAEKIKKLTKLYGRLNSLKIMKETN